MNTPLLDPRGADLVSRLISSRDELEQLTRLGEWGLDLRARTWRTQQVFIYADTNCNFGPLADEIKTYKRVVRAFKVLRGRSAK